MCTPHRKKARSGLRRSRGWGRGPPRTRASPTKAGRLGLGAAPGWAHCRARRPAGARRRESFGLALLKGPSLQTRGLLSALPAAPAATPPRGKKPVDPRGGRLPTFSAAGRGRRRRARPSPGPRRARRPRRGRRRWSPGPPYSRPPTAPRPGPQRPSARPHRAGAGLRRPRRGRDAASVGAPALRGHPRRRPRAACPLFWSRGPAAPPLTASERGARPVACAPAPGPPAPPRAPRPGTARSPSVGQGGAHMPPPRLLAGPASSVSEPAVRTEGARGPGRGGGGGGSRRARRAGAGSSGLGAGPEGSLLGRPALCVLLSPRMHAQVGPGHIGSQGRGPADEGREPGDWPDLLEDLVPRWVLSVAFLPPLDI